MTVWYFELGTGAEEKREQEVKRGNIHVWRVLSIYMYIYHKTLLCSTAKSGISLQTWGDRLSVFYAWLRHASCHPILTHR